MSSPTLPPPKLPDERDRHVDQWQRNRAFAATIDRTFHDWIVNVAFYAALHCVDALLSHDGIRVHTHTERHAALLGNRRYEQIRIHFSPFYGLCRTTRYLADPKIWVPYDMIDAKVLHGYLYPIEKSVKKLAGITADSTPIVLKN